MAKERTAEEKAAKKEIKAAKNKVKRTALLSVIEFVKGRKNVPDEIKSALKVITPGLRIGTGGPSKLKVFAGMFSDKSEVTEIEIFTAFKAGRAEMRKICVSLIKKMKPADRIWVRLDVPDEKYVVEGYGSDAPKGWAGYQPVEIEDTEII